MSKAGPSKAADPPGISRPQAQLFNPAAADTPFAALIRAAAAGTSLHAPVARQGGANTQIAELYATLSKHLQDRGPLCAAAPQALQAHIQSDLSAAPRARSKGLAARSSSNISGQYTGGKIDDQLEGADDAEYPDEGDAPETSSNDNSTVHRADSSAPPIKITTQLPMSAEAKKKRRQEINRESARRVRKRKSLEHQQLREQVESLQLAAAAAATEQACLAHAVTQVTQERDALLQHAGESESKWLTAECRCIILRQRISELEGVSIDRVSLVDGRLLSPQGEQQQL